MGMVQSSTGKMGDGEKVIWGGWRFSRKVRFKFQLDFELTQIAVITLVQSFFFSVFKELSFKVTVDECIQTCQKRLRICCVIALILVVVRTLRSGMRGVRAIRECFPI